jgi:hypothetical protein
MKNLLSFVGLGLLSLGVTGCGSMSVSRIMGNDSPSVMQAQARQDLTMPPDLQLPPPGTVTSEATQTTAAPAAGSAQPQAQVVANPSQGQAEGDVYERNGISKVHVDGTPKSESELKAELKKVYLAKKQQTQPHYGTIFNIGNIFNDS